MPNNEIKTRYMCFLFVLFGFFPFLLLLFLVCWQFMWQASLSGIELRLRDIVEFCGHRAQNYELPATLSGPSLGALSGECIAAFKFYLWQRIFI